MGFKNAVLTAGIGALGTIAVNGLKPLNILVDNLTAPTQPVGVVYAAPAEPSLWSTVMWWFVPVSIGCLVLCCVGFVGAVCYNLATGGKKTEKKETKDLAKQKEFDQWRMEKVFGSIAQAAKTKPEPLPEPVKPAIKWLSLVDAIEKSTKDTWILGQAVEKQLDKNKLHIAGELFRASSNAHFAILGATRSGKTKSAAFLLVLLARKFNWHVIVLDGKGGQDWRKYNGAVEWHDLTPDNLAYYVDAISRLYKRRQDYLNMQDAGEISELPHGKKMPHILVIFEEFGSTWVAADRSKEVDTQMDELMRRSCAAGVHLGLIDQAPQLWSANMTTNAANALCFRAKGQTLNAFGGYYCGNLNVGEFCDGTSIYQSWYVAGEYDLRQLPPLQKRLLADPLFVREQSGSGRSHETNSLTNVHERTFTNSLPVIAAGSNDNKAKWVPWIEEYAKTNPGILQTPAKGIRELARAMSEHETGTTENDSKYVGIASETCRLLRDAKKTMRIVA